MADNESSSDSSSSKKGLFRLILLIGIIGIASIAGFASAQFFVGGTETGPQQEQVDPLDGISEEADKDTEFSYFEFEPITTNLDDPRQTRHVRIVIMLGIKAKAYDVVNKVIEKRKFELRDWIDTYLAGCTLEEIRGAQNRNRIRRKIWETLNDKLWPGRKPLIDHILFKDFKVQ